MFKLPKSVLSLAAGAIALGVLILAAPRAAHAIAATLVQMTNTSANPAIAQDVSKLASQNVILQSNISTAVLPNSSSTLFQILPNGTQMPFVVPAGQNLVVTTVDVSALNGTGVTEAGIGNVVGTGLRAAFYVPNGVTTQFQFPNGYVFPSGESVYAQNGGNGSMSFTVHGYLTTN
jgi:hypothetical protein